MSTTLYKQKVSPGGKITYVPIKEYAPELTDSIYEGAHLIVCKPGSKVIKHNINPDYASVIAASIIAREEIIARIVDESMLRPEKTPLTPEQKTAYNAFIEAMGKESCRLTYGSIFDAVTKGIDKMVECAVEYSEIPAVKETYNNFIEQYTTLIKLTEEK